MYSWCSVNKCVRLAHLWHRCFFPVIKHLVFQQPEFRVFLLTPQRIKNAPWQLVHASRSVEIHFLSKGQVTNTLARCYDQTVCMCVCGSPPPGRTSPWWWRSSTPCAGSAARRWTPGCRCVPPLQSVWCTAFDRSSERRCPGPLLAWELGSRGVRV